jgi:hypothetical protein
MDRCWNKRRSNAPIAAAAHTESDSIYNLIRRVGSPTYTLTHSIMWSVYLDVVDFRN